MYDCKAPLSRFYYPDTRRIINAFIIIIIIIINNKPIQMLGETNEQESIKFLGIYLDKHLTFKQHINFLCSSISRCIFAINRVKHILPLKALKSLYFALIQSRLQYCIAVWGNSNHVQKLLLIQKRAIRIIKTIDTILTRFSKQIKLKKLQICTSITFHRSCMILHTIFYLAHLKDIL